MFDRVARMGRTCVFNGVRREGEPKDLKKMRKNACRYIFVPTPTGTVISILVLMAQNDLYTVDL